MISFFESSKKKYSKKYDESSFGHQKNCIRHEAKKENQEKNSIRKKKENWSNTNDDRAIFLSYERDWGNKLFFHHHWRWLDAHARVRDFNACFCTRVVKCTFKF